jgi:Flp pilus assembly protein TadG
MTYFRRLRDLLRAPGGTAAVEFALVAPILMGMLVPVVDLSMAFAQRMEVQQAAQAGAQYALLHAWNSNSATNIAAAVTAASNLPGLSATPAPSQFCGCPGGSAITSTTCGSTCSDGTTAGYYVTVSAQYTYTPVVPYSVLGSSVTLSSQSTVRTQ